MSTTLAAVGLAVIQNRGEGDCGPLAFSDASPELGMSDKDVRARTVETMIKHRDFFQCFHFDGDVADSYDGRCVKMAQPKSCFDNVECIAWQMYLDELGGSPARKLVFIKIVRGEGGTFKVVSAHLNAAGESDDPASRQLAAASECPGGITAQVIDNLPSGTIIVYFTPNDVVGHFEATRRIGANEDAPLAHANAHATTAGLSEFTKQNDIHMSALTELAALSDESSDSDETSVPSSSDDESDASSYVSDLDTDCESIQSNDMSHCSEYEEDASDESPAEKHESPDAGNESSATALTVADDEDNATALKDAIPNASGVTGATNVLPISKPKKSNGLPGRPWHVGGRRARLSHPTDSQVEAISNETRSRTRSKRALPSSPEPSQDDSAQPPAKRACISRAKVAAETALTSAPKDPAAAPTNAPALSDPAARALLPSAAGNTSRVKQTRAQKLAAKTAKTQARLGTHDSTNALLNSFSIPLSGVTDETSRQLWIQQNKPVPHALARDRALGLLASPLAAQTALNSAARVVGAAVNDISFQSPVAPRSLASTSMTDVIKTPPSALSALPPAEHSSRPPVPQALPQLSILPQSPPIVAAITGTKSNNGILSPPVTNNWLDKAGNSLLSQAKFKTPDPRAGQHVVRASGSSCTPSTRALEFARETFYHVPGKCDNPAQLRCRACSQKVDWSRRNSCIDHIGSNRHKTSMEKLAASQADAERIKLSFGNSEVTNEAIRVFRLRVLKAFMIASIPGSALQITVDGKEIASPLRDLLEGGSGAERLAGPRVMSDYIPYVLADEQSLTDAEFDRARAQSPDGEFRFSIISDGTTHCAECLNVVIRFVLDGKVTQRLLALKLLAAPITGFQLASFISTCVTQRGALRSRLKMSGMLAFMHDRASVNTVAAESMSALSFSPLKFLDSPCWSHTGNNAGNALNFPLVNQFLVHWHTLGVSLKAGKIYLTIFQESRKGYCQTRWYSGYEQVAQQLPKWSRLPLFLRACIDEDVCIETAQLLLELVTQLAFRAQMTCYVDIGRHFVTSTYFLETDSPIAPFAYPHIQCLLAMGSTTPWHHPLVDALAAEVQASQPAIGGNPNAGSSIIDMCHHGAQPAIDYLTQRVATDRLLHSSIEFFRLCQFLNPIAVLDGLVLPPLQAALDTIPFLSPVQRIAIWNDIPNYVQLVQLRGRNFFNHEPSLLPAEVQYGFNEYNFLPHEH